MRGAGGMTLGRTLAAIGVAVGMGIAGAYLLDFHRHQCPRCGRRWAHLGMLSYGNSYAHLCPEPGCETVQWWRVGHEAERSKLFVDDVLGGIQRSSRGVLSEGAPPAKMAIAPIALEPSMMHLLPPMKGG